MSKGKQSKPKACFTIPKITLIIVFEHRMQQPNYYH